ncbi:unnamed protein product [Caenorhabditis nigoni]
MLQFITNLWNWKKSSKQMPKSPSKQQLLNELSEIVFEYMEPNFRFLLSLRLPSLRSIEKRTHLKINLLYLRDNAIMIDKTAYTFSIDRRCKSKDLRFRVWDTVDYDVDEFGYEISTKYIMMNGDVFMENDSTRDKEDEESSYTTAKRKKEPKCKSTLKLAITPENGEPSIYTCSKPMKIYEGMKMLIAAIFGNRTVIWNVESMDIWTSNLRWIVSGRKPFSAKCRTRFL